MKEMDKCAHALFPGGQMQFLIRTVEVVIVQRKTGQDRIDSQSLFEHQHRTDPAAAPLKDGRFSKGRSKCVGHRQNLWRFTICPQSLVAYSRLKIPGNRRGKMCL